MRLRHHNKHLYWILIEMGWENCLFDACLDELSSIIDHKRKKRNQCFRQGLLVIKVLYIRFWPRNRNCSQLKGDAGFKILQITTRQKETWRHVSLW